MGHLAAERLRAGMVAEAMAGRAEPAGPLLGLPTSKATKTSGVDIEGLRRRRPHWFTTPALA